MLLQILVVVIVSTCSSSLSQYTNSTENMTGAQEGDGQEIDTGDEAEQALTVSRSSGT